LTDEARQEGERALAALARLPRPTMDDHASRNTFRALARAHEGAGHDAVALKWYSEFVEFGSGFNKCSGCHQLAGPNDSSFFRDWWAGRKFAELAWRTGEAPRLIEADEAAIAKDPNSLLAQIRLAYLYEGHGDAERARRLWELVDSDSAAGNRRK
jgi:predicted Zn-dependent protease